MIVFGGRFGAGYRGKGRRVAARRFRVGERRRDPELSIGRCAEDQPLSGLESATETRWGNETLEYKLF